MHKESILHSMATLGNTGEQFSRVCLQASDSTVKRSCELHLRGYTPSRAGGGTFDKLRSLLISLARKCVPTKRSRIMAKTPCQLYPWDRRSKSKWLGFSSSTNTKGGGAEERDNRLLCKELLTKRKTKILHM